MKSEALRRWRLVLGKESDSKDQVRLGEEEQDMDDVLEALYDSDREGNLGSSSPRINRWLGDIRKYFPSPVVQIMQKDALEILGLERMLLEPELLRTLEVDVHLVATLLSLQEIMPDKTRETARKVVQELTDKLLKKIKDPLRSSVKGAMNKALRNYRPRANEIDWNKTILKNLKHYQPQYKTIIPERLIGFGRKRSGLKHVFLLVDQSASMASSVVYASIFGAVLASVPSLGTHLVLFDTAVADLTHKLEDPVDLLFGAQLGGGTDINNALAYLEKLISRPSDSIVFLISDLYEGGNEEEMVSRVKAFMENGIQVICLLALDDTGSPDYDKEMAEELAKLDCPAFACTPEFFPELIGAAIQKKSIKSLLANKGLAHK
ncbi:MAG: VWA domain-containing protein [Saprospiraceae bacterium]|nr:VWA domain-containing protein [Saprospiraceae bacterium]